MTYILYCVIVALAIVMAVRSYFEVSDVDKRVMKSLKASLRREPDTVIRRSVLALSRFA